MPPTQVKGARPHRYEKREGSRNGATRRRVQLPAKWLAAAVTLPAGETRATGAQTLAQDEGGGGSDVD